jgi:hypothetical protein
MKMEEKMQITNVRKGDVINIPTEGQWCDFKDDKWRVLEVYQHMVLAHSISMPEIRRCFSYGDLILLGLEVQGFNHAAALQEMRTINLIEGQANYKRKLRKCGN